MSGYDTQYMAVGDSAEPSRGGGIGWILGILLIIVVIIAVIFLILWLVNRNQTTKQLSLTNPTFSITSSNQMRAVWTGAGNPDDVVNLYVVRSGPALTFTSAGVPTGTTQVVARAGPVNGAVLSVTATPSLALGVSYTGYLIVTNPNISDNYKPYSSQSLAVGPVGPTGAFHIQAIGQNGEIVYSIPDTTFMTGATGAVGYNFSGQITANNNLFYYDSNQNICTISLSQHSAANANTDTPLTCADFGNNFVLSGDTNVLSLKQFGPTGDSGSATKWKYDTSNNSWCVANGTTSKCMQLSSTNVLTSLITFKGGIDRTILTVNTPGVVLRVGQVISGQGVENGTVIVALGSLTGTYTLNIDQGTVPDNTDMTAQSFTPINLTTFSSTNAGWTNPNFFFNLS